MTEPESLEGVPGPLRTLVDELAELPGVEAVALGGSRARGTAGPGSDWDFGVYYRGSFDPADVRALGHTGTVSGIGEWGGGVFNGGAWLQVGDQSVDLHWRDLAVVDREIAEADAGHWHQEPLMFHLAGIPTYLILAELAINRVLTGRLPHVVYPDALRSAAGRGWAQRAELTLGYARDAHARNGRIAACLGLLAVGATEFAHAVAALTGRWVTNDKDLFGIGRLALVDQIVADIGPDPTPDDLVSVVDATIDLGRSAVADVGLPSH